MQGVTHNRYGTHSHGCCCIDRVQKDTEKGIQYACCNGYAYAAVKKMPGKAVRKPMDFRSAIASLA